MMYLQYKVFSLQKFNVKNLVLSLVYKRTKAKKNTKISIKLSR